MRSFGFWKVRALAAVAVAAGLGVWAGGFGGGRAGAQAPRKPVVEQLRAIRDANRALIERQTKVGQEIDAMTETARQIKTFCKRA